GARLDRQVHAVAAAVLGVGAFHQPEIVEGGQRPQVVAAAHGLVGDHHAAVDPERVPAAVGGAVHRQAVAAEDRDHPVGGDLDVFAGQPGVGGEPAAAGPPVDAGL